MNPDEEPKRERQAAGPGDDHLIRMRVFNSYKQIKFSGVGIAGRKEGLLPMTVDSQKTGSKVSHEGHVKVARSIASKGDPTENEINKHHEHDSIFPSDGEQDVDD